MQKLHFYIFSFIHGNGTRTSLYTGYPDQKVSIPRLDAAKEYAGVPLDAVLIGLGYMGHMTPEEMKTLS